MADDGEWACGVCHEVIGEQCLAAFGKYYHKSCFKCSNCRKPIVGKRCVEKNDLPFCLECGVTVCASCAKHITKDGIQAMDMCWHAKCFVCRRCKKSFDKDGGKFVVGPENRPLCLKCGNKYVDQTQNSAREEAGGNSKKRRGGGLKTLFKGGSGSGRRGNTAKTGEKCATCSKVIAPNATCLIALNKSYHRQCFVCRKCKTLLEGNQFVAHGNSPLCRACAIDKLAETCAACKEPITETIVVALKRNWHPHCLVCSHCGDAIVNYGKVYRRGKDPCCPKCVETVFDASYRPQSKLRPKGQDLLNSFDLLLQDEDGINYFLKFVTLDYSVENMLFWLDIQQYKDIFASLKREDAALYANAITRKYVMEDSELQINIDGKTRTAIEVAVSSSSPPSSDVFDGAVEEILELMYNSSFMKFQSSAQAQELLEKMG